MKSWVRFFNVMENASQIINTQRKGCGRVVAGVELLAHLGILLIVVLLCANPASNHVVLDSVGQREIVITQS